MREGDYEAEKRTRFGKKWTAGHCFLPKAKIFLYNVLHLGIIPSFLNRRRMESLNLLILGIFLKMTPLVLLWLGLWQHQQLGFCDIPSFKADCDSLDLLLDRSVALYCFLSVFTADSITKS